MSVPDISGIHSTCINEAILRRPASGGTGELSAVPILTPANFCQLYNQTQTGNQVLQALAPLPLPARTFFSWGAGAP